MTIVAPFLLAKDCSSAGFSVDEQPLGILRFACGHVYELTLCMSVFIIEVMFTNTPSDSRSQ